MVVLIVDDLTNVVSGLVSGIDWDSINVNRVLTAYNAIDAKKILRQYKIDVMLCDIEMPAENGLSLFRWVKENEIELECIFLTSHADFLYTKQAVQLGSFDYILQPARYEDIAKAIVSANKKIEIKKQSHKYTTYGQLLYHKKDKIIDGIMYDWYYNKTVDNSSIENDFKMLKLNINNDSDVYIVTISIVEWKTLSHWENGLFKATLINIIVESFGKYGQKIILSEIDTDTYMFVVYNDNNEIMDNLSVVRELENLVYLFDDFFGIRVAAYSANYTKFVEVGDVVNGLKQLKSNNVMLKNGVFWLEDAVQLENSLLIKGIDVQGCASSIYNGGALSVRENCLAYLDKVSNNENFGARELKIFYHNYMQIIYISLERLGIKPQDMFDESEILEKSLKGYETVEDMKQFIIISTEYLYNQIKQRHSEKNVVERIIAYIYNNIEYDIRRDDIANVVYLHPDYVSRLFKKEKGMSLKEFIVLSKMQQAQVLLKTTNIRISIVATKVGYSNFSHFSQVYKKIMGISPTEERENRNE